MTYVNYSETQDLDSTDCVKKIWESPAIVKLDTLNTFGGKYTTTFEDQDPFNTFGAS